MWNAGVDFVQERFMGQGAQDNESAVEQAKDEQISDFSEFTYTCPTCKSGERYETSADIERSPRTVQVADWF